MHPDNSEKGLSGMHPDHSDEDAKHAGPPELLSWERPALRKLLANNAEHATETMGPDSGQNQMS